MDEKKDDAESLLDRARGIPRAKSSVAKPDPTWEEFEAVLAVVRGEITFAQLADARGDVGRRGRGSPRANPQQEIGRILTYGVRRGWLVAVDTPRG